MIGQLVLEQHGSKKSTLTSTPPVSSCYSSALTFWPPTIAMILKYNEPWNGTVQGRPVSYRFSCALSITNAPHLALSKHYPKMASPLAPGQTRMKPSSTLSAKSAKSLKKLLLAIFKHSP